MAGRRGRLGPAKGQPGQKPIFAGVVGTAIAPRPQPPAPRPVVPSSRPAKTTPSRRRAPGPRSTKPPRGRATPKRAKVPPASGSPARAQPAPAPVAAPAPAPAPAPTPTAAPTPIPAAADPVERGVAVLRYNHYRHEFAITSPPGAIAVEAINETFSFSYGFKGAYVIQARGPGEAGPRLGRSADGMHLEGFAVGTEFWVEVDEDPEVLAREAAAPRPVRPQAENEASELLRRRNGHCDDITSQLKGMSADELRARGPEYQRLIEARDLEDIMSAMS